MVEKCSRGRLAERDSCGTWYDLGESLEVDPGGVERECAIAERKPP